MNQKFISLDLEVIAILASCHGARPVAAATSASVSRRDADDDGVVGENAAGVGGESATLVERFDIEPFPDFSAK